MRHNLYFAAILPKGLPLNALTHIARRLGAISGPGPALLVTLGLLLAMPWAQAQKKAPLSVPEEQQLFGRVKDIPGLIEQRKLAPAQIPSPHWRDDACQACHAGSPDAKPVKLHERSVARLCQFCHDAIFDHSYIHSVAIEPDEDMIQRMRPSYRDALVGADRVLSCTTCHDLVIQCLPEFRNKKVSNARFFRDGPFPTRTEQCYFCHDARRYERINPHEQVGDDGRLRDGTCKLCHQEAIDDLQAVQSVEELRFTVGTDLAAMCTRCHLREPHPGGQFAFGPSQSNPNHLVKPPNLIRERMQLRSEQTGLNLPLEPGSGKIYCATCHEPHEAGAITDRQIAKDPKIRYRLRGVDMCLRCHDK